MNHIHSAGIVTYTLQDNTINYLLLHYPDNHWDFPKGKIENNETKQDAANRELLEETGLSAELDDTFLESYSYSFIDQQKQVSFKTVYFFLGQTTENTIQLSHEHIGYQWLTYNHALEKLTYDNAKNVLKKAHKHLLS